MYRLAVEKQIDDCNNSSDDEGGYSEAEESFDDTDDLSPAHRFLVDSPNIWTFTADCKWFVWIRSLPMIKNLDLDEIENEVVTFSVTIGAIPIEVMQYCAELKKRTINDLEGLQPEDTQYTITLVAPGIIQTTAEVGVTFIPEGSEAKTCTYIMFTFPLAQKNASHRKSIIMN